MIVEHPCLNWTAKVVNTLQKNKNRRFCSFGGIFLGQKHKIARFCAFELHR